MGKVNRNRKPFLSFTAKDAKEVMLKIGIKTMSEQARYLECSTSYWSLLVNTKSEQELNDKLGILLLHKLNSKLRLYYNQPKSLIKKWIKANYEVDGTMSKLALKRYAPLLNIKNVKQPLKKNQLDLIRELTRLNVKELVSIYGSGAIIGDERHINLSKFFYSKDSNKELPSNKSIRLWIGLMIYFEEVKLENFKEKISRLLNDD